MALLCGLLDGVGGSYTIDAQDILHAYRYSEYDIVVERLQDPFMYRFTLKEKDDQGSLRNSRTG